MVINRAVSRCPPLLLLSFQVARPIDHFFQILPLIANQYPSLCRKPTKNDDSNRSLERVGMATSPTSTLKEMHSGVKESMSKVYSGVMTPLLSAM